jgi:hypothetical protein
MFNEAERPSRGRGRAPLDKPAKQRLIYVLTEKSVLDKGEDFGSINFSSRAGS